MFCKLCNIDKLEESFAVVTIKRPTGAYSCRRHICIDCRKEQNREYAKLHRKKASERARTWYIVNKEKALVRNKEYRQSYQKPVEVRFKAYRNDAKQREKTFDLSFEKFKELVTGQCYWCGTYEKIGIDRLDSSQGYFDSNCVSCCGICNRIKYTLSPEQFLNQCEKIVKFRSRVSI